MPVLPSAGASPGMRPSSGGGATAVLPDTGADAGPVAALRAQIAWRPVLLCSSAVFTVLVALSPWYGYYRDELYFRMLAEHAPSWGYVDQPPLTPLLAKAGIWLFGDTVTGIRVPAALCTAVTVVLAAMIAAELGGRRRAQLITALATGTALYPLLVGHTLLTSSPDLVAWTAVWLLAARALLRHDGRWWLAAGAVFGLALYNKYLILLLGVGIIAGLAVCGPRRVLRSRWLAAGVLLALVIGSPNLIYQAVHGWPQFRMASALANEAGMLNRLVTLPGQLVLIGLPLVPVWIGGMVALFRSQRWRAVRSLAAAHLGVVALVLISNGRMDYAAATLVPLLAAGCVRLEDWSYSRRGRRWFTGAIAGNAAISALVVLPVVPVGWLAHTPVPLLNPEVRDGVGWSDLAGRVAQVQHSLPISEQRRDVLLAEDYGEAGALARYGDRYHLPDVYSGHNQLGKWMPPATARNVVAVGVDPATLAPGFTHCAVADHVEVGVEVGDAERDVPITVCRGRLKPWTELWPHLTHLG